MGKKYYNYIKSHCNFIAAVCIVITVMFMCHKVYEYFSMFIINVRLGKRDIFPSAREITFHQASFLMCVIIIELECDFGIMFIKQ
jgi:hypothetical protein